jgi:hypothetical protein
MLKPVHAANPSLSIADSWCLAGAAAVEFSGGPKVPVSLGRVDAAGGSACPENGRLPDAAQGAAHLRDVFYRQGFDDREIVALSGAHTLGRCHLSRSGFDGPWTSNPLKFDNEYFVNLLTKKWTERQWEGNRQFEDETGTLMMLPTDIALIEDAAFKPHVERYAADNEAFATEFAAVFAKLMANGCPMAKAPPTQTEATTSFLEHSMHGSIQHCKKYQAEGADVLALESTSNRSALHKAAFWGHTHLICYLVHECKIPVNAVDSNGDTALNDAVRFGHGPVVEILLSAKADASIKNVKGQDAMGVAAEYGQASAAEMLAKAGASAAGSSSLSNLPPALMERVIGSLLTEIDELKAAKK